MPTILAKSSGFANPSPDLETVDFLEKKARSSCTRFVLDLSRPGLNPALDILIESLSSSNNELNIFSWAISANRENSESLIKPC